MYDRIRMNRRQLRRYLHNRPVAICPQSPGWRPILRPIAIMRGHALPLPGEIAWIEAATRRDDPGPRPRVRGFLIGWDSGSGKCWHYAVVSLHRDRFEPFERSERSRHVRYLR